MVMKISEFNIQKYSKSSNVLQTQNNKTFEPVNVQKSAIDIQGNYNVAFSGLFKSAQCPSAVNIFEPVQMEPMKEYYISQDTSFMLDNYLLDLKTPYITSLISALKPNESLIFGREGINLGNMPQSVSRRHLQITKTKDGKLTAMDLGSKFGSKILPDIRMADLSNYNCELKPNTRYLFPYNTVLSIGNQPICLTDLKSRIMSLKDSQKLIIGRDDACDIKLNDNKVSRRHLQLEKYQDGVIVKDLNSTNGTKYLGLDTRIKSSIVKADYSNISEERILEKNTPTLIPNDCQLYLGRNFTLDMRNPSIINLLNKKGEITIGRSYDNDIIAESFYSKVSRKHLKLQKYGTKIIATDMGATNTTAVIPKNKIKAFYEGAENIELAQHNIGDCYLLASIYSLAKNPYGAKLLENMVTVLPDGKYCVKFYKEDPIYVKPDELDGQKKQDGSEKYSVSGDLGIKAIERAYAKLINNFDDGKTLFMKIDDGGYTETSLYKMTGIKSKKYNTHFHSMDKILSKIGYDNFQSHIITCTTPYSKSQYVDAQNRFDVCHAYSVTAVNPIKRTITVANPHDTTLRYEISWSEFSEYFDALIDAELS